MKMCFFCSNIGKDSAIVDYIDEDNDAQLRHIFRLASLAEKPIPASEQSA